VADLLQEYVIAGPRRRARGDALKAGIEACLNLSAIRKFYKNLLPAEQGDFKLHLKRYLDIWRVDAGFEITSTNRYKSNKAESCVLALRHIKKYGVLPHLSGTLVAMTEEEEEYYEAGQDFSIIYSHRLGSMCLFLGPARFVNHDCEPNATFIVANGNIAVASIRNIEVGEEITIAYSPDYFGPGNVDCRCASCERGGKGYYRSAEERNRDSDGRHRGKNSSQRTPKAESASQEAKRRGVVPVELSYSSKKKEARHSGPQSIMDANGSHKKLGAAMTDSFIIDSDDESFLEALVSTTDRENLDLEDPTQLTSAMSKLRTTQGVGRQAEDETSHSTNEEIASNASKDMENADALRKSLRPRNAKVEYNLRKQSKESVLPISCRPAPMKKKKDPTKNYCYMCEEETPIKEMSKQMADSGTKELFCKRCRRHSKLYGSPWPERAPLPRRVLGELEGQGDSYTEDSPRRIKAAQMQRTDWRSPDGKRVSMPGLSSKKPIMQPMLGLGEQMRHIKLAGKGSVSMGLPACVACRRMHRRCSMATANQASCDQCKQAGRRCFAHRDDERAALGGAYREFSPSPEPVLTIDGTHGDYSSNDSFIQSKPALMTFVSRLDRYSGKLMQRQAQLRRDLAAQRRQEKLMELPVEARREGMHGDYGKSGSWYYVEVPVADDGREAAPVLTQSRLRSQERGKVAESRMDCGRKHNFLSPDTSDDEFSSFMRKAKRQSAAKQKQQTDRLVNHIKRETAKAQKKEKKRKREESKESGIPAGTKKHEGQRPSSETSSSASSIPKIPFQPGTTGRGRYFYEPVDSDEEQRKRAPVVFDNRLSRPRSYRTGSYKE
jgi:hypothetical protein